MTEQIKKEAEELVGSFMPHAYFFDLDPDDKMYKDQFENAKQCAIICCDKIKKALDKVQNYPIENYLRDNDLYTQLKQYIKTKM